MVTALVVHGHFYQPPRENPWTEMVDREPSANPFHDWNERIHSECYRPNGYARIVDNFGRVERIVNNYSKISFNFGPTLLSWLELKHPETYARILEADKESVRRRGGHGNAIAQGYNHVILPLCNERDRRTQVRWGISDFRHRFGRDPESLWLPETGCNDETLETLIEEGMRYVVLSPYQAERVRTLQAAEWRSVADGGVDTTVPYKYFHRDGSGRSIVIFFYDGPVARALAFEGALASSQGLVDHFLRAARAGGSIVNVATDGESYGHHYHFGDRCLAYALETEAPSRGFWVTNYGEFLDHHPPVMEVEIRGGPENEGTAWSCVHGLGRWMRDCGCQGGALEGWNQAWRTPLREALDYLRDEAARQFESGGGDLFRDPWEARDAYIEVIINNHRTREDFLRRYARKSLSAEEQTKALTFLELQRNAMLMYTSCGWFFADISGIETVQLMKYAARVLDLMGELQLPSGKDEFLARLSVAKSNLPAQGNGADIFHRRVEPCKVSPRRVAANLAISELMAPREKEGRAAGYIYRLEDFQKQQHVRLTLATGRIALERIATGKQHTYALALMHLGDVDLHCVLRPFPGEEAFKRASDALWAQFPAASAPAMLRLAQAEFGSDDYGLEDLLPEGRERVSERLFDKAIERFAEQYALLYEDNRRTIEMLQDAGFELPMELRTAAETNLGKCLEEEIRKHQESEDPAAFQRAIEIVEEAARRGYHIVRPSVGQIFEAKITAAIRTVVSNPSAENIEAAIALIKLAVKLHINANLEQAQEAFYEAIRDNITVPEELGGLALLIGLAPSLLTNAQPAIADKMKTSILETTLS